MASVRRVDVLPNAYRLSASDILADLLGSALKKMGLGKGTAYAQTGDERLNAAQRFIREHLFDEALSPSRVARATNLSRTTLYRVFEAAGGVRKYIQTQRLARLKSSLSDPFERQSVAALAYASGFASEHHANRSFRQEFGLPPAKFRREVLLSVQSKYGDDGSALKRNLMAWYSDLYWSTLKYGDQSAGR